MEDINDILEKLTKTLLYEGYSLFPYYRSSIKNQKPIPFGVIFPKDYHAFHEFSFSEIQSQTVLISSNELTVNIGIRFLHLRKTELFQKVNDAGDNHDFVPTGSFDVNGKTYQAGWQTIERKINTGQLPIADLLKESKTIPIEFDNMNEGEIIFNEEKEIVARQTTSVCAIKGNIKIKAEKINDKANAFRLTVTVINLTPVRNAPAISRDDVFMESFLSTHIILQTENGIFISHQDTGDEWKDAIGACANVNTWPILIDKGNTTLLSSPIILYDYPEINSKSSGILFDSTEIEEALLLHVNLLSDEDKKRIGSNDEKLQAMLNRVNSMTPEDLRAYHSMMKDSAPGEITNK